MFRQFLRDFHQVLTLRCQAHRRFQAQRMDGPLRMADRMAMWGHWIACGPCRKAVRQLVRIDALARELASQSPSDGLTASARERIRIAISQDGLEPLDEPATET
ncbi:MAG: hypothetical protein AAF670_14685 [Planctomycetota bacterium]